MLSICLEEKIKNFNKRHHANVNLNLMEENVIQIKCGII